MPALTVASHAIRCVLRTKSKGVTIMTTVNNRKVSSPSSKDEAPKEKGFFNRPRFGGKTMWDWLNLLGILAIPLVVVAATLLFGIQQANLANQQHENDQKI